MKLTNLTKTLAVGGLSLALCTASIPRAEAFPWGVAVGAVVVGGVVGYVIGKQHCASAMGCANAYPGYASLKYRDSSYQYRANAAIQRCAVKFKSFNANTGLITRAGGVKEPCPYL